MLHFYEVRSTRATNNKALNFDVPLEQIEEHERDFSRSFGPVVIGTQNNMRVSQLEGIDLSVDLNSKILQSNISNKI